MLTAREWERGGGSQSHYSDEFRASLKERRESLGLTIADVSQMSGIPGGNIRDMEQGGRIWPHQLKAVMNALEMKR